MSDPKSDQPPVDPVIADAKARLEVVAKLFDDLAATIELSIRDIGPVTLVKTKAMLAKLSELQSAHLLVLKSQEVFHDTCDQRSDGGDSIDYTAIRDDIGRALDRIRAAAEPD